MGKRSVSRVRAISSVPALSTCRVLRSTSISTWSRRLQHKTFLTALYELINNEINNKNPHKNKQIDKLEKVKENVIILMHKISTKKPDDIFNNSNKNSRVDIENIEDKSELIDY